MVGTAPRGGDHVRRLAILATVATLLLLAAPPAQARPAGHVSGGGAGTFGADLDGDGDIDGSRFGVGVVVLDDGSARGHFECLMAGASDFLGLRLMAVEGNVTGGSIDAASGTAEFAGIATVNLGQGSIARGIPFHVRVSAGGSGTGTLTLTVIGAFDGVPGDRAPGNGNYDLPEETVERGQIRVH
jgi:hypothetical protein